MAKPHRFVVYHVASTMEKRTFYYRQHAEKLAKGLNGYAVASIEDYRTKIVHMVERTNLMSGKKYMEPSNTPNYCSPASEAYWSM